LQEKTTLTKAEQNDVITVMVSGSNKEFTLPPDLSAIKIAGEGEYKLRSTEEIVVNPDLLATWTITAPSE
jgi:hypothetical protein